MYSKDSLTNAENKLLELYVNHRVAFLRGTPALRTSMRYVYYVGETFRRAFQGTWVVLPSRTNPDEPPAGSGIDFPMREAIIDPKNLIKIALQRRTGEEITRIYGYAERDYNRWIEAGKPERAFIGTLREDD